MLPRTKELPEAGLGLVLERSLVSKETHPALGFSETRRTGIGNASIARREATQPALGHGHCLPRRRMPRADPERTREFRHTQAHGQFLGREVSRDGARLAGGGLFVSFRRLQAVASLAAKPT